MFGSPLESVHVKSSRAILRALEILLGAHVALMCWKVVLVTQQSCSTKPDKVVLTALTVTSDKRCKKLDIITKLVTGTKFPSPSVFALRFQKCTALFSVGSCQTFYNVLKRI